MAVIFECLYTLFASKSPQPVVRDSMTSCCSRPWIKNRWFASSRHRSFRGTGNPYRSWSIWRSPRILPNMKIGFSLRSSQSPENKTRAQIHTDCSKRHEITEMTHFDSDNKELHRHIKTFHPYRTRTASTNSTGNKSSTINSIKTMFDIFINVDTSFFYQYTHILIGSHTQSHFRHLQVHFTIINCRSTFLTVKHGFDLTHARNVAGLTILDSYVKPTVRCSEKILVPTGWIESALDDSTTKTKCIKQMNKCILKLFWLFMFCSFVVRAILKNRRKRRKETKSAASASRERRIQASSTFIWINYLLRVALTKELIFRKNRTRNWRTCIIV